MSAAAVVAVTGMGAVHPFGRGLDALWEGVLGKAEGVGPIAHFDASAYPTRFAAEVPERVRRALPAPDAEWATRFALAAIDDALADAGLRGGGGAGGQVHFGFESLCSDFEPAAQLLAAAAVDGRVQASLLCRDLGPRARHVAEWGLHERFLREVVERVGCLDALQVIGAACASGAEAIGAGYRAIRRGRARWALVGGSDCKVNPTGMGLASHLGMTSRRNQAPQVASRPFDRERDGAVIGEGAAALLLEPLEAALGRGARVHALVTGFASTCDAHRVTDPAEDARSAAAAIRGALRDAERSRVDYVNAHGTSTPMNDRTEVTALRAAFERAPLPAVSSTKGATGHLMAASGAVEALVCIRALQQQTIPPTLHFETPDPRCDLDVTANQPRHQRLESVLSSSFGFGGQNACLVFERSHPAAPSKGEGR